MRTIKFIAAFGFLPVLLSAQTGHLNYSSYFGGDGVDVIHAVATDPAGNVYLTGETTSSNLPVTSGAFQSKSAGVPGTRFGLIGPPALPDAFVAKLSPAGQVLYCTYLGGADGDAGTAIAVDSKGSAYILGVTLSANFPATPGAYQTTLPAGKIAAFVTKLSADGSTLVYSTYLGGPSTYSGYSSGAVYQSTGTPHALALDAAGNVYIGGNAAPSNFPATAGTYNNSGGAFVAKLTAGGGSLAFVTYLGGGATDTTRAIALDSSGNIYAAGSTSSSNFPISTGALHATIDSNGSAAFVVKLDPAATHAIYSATLDNTAIGYGLAVDGSGNAYVAGSLVTSSSDTNGFVEKLNPAASQVIYSTPIAGSASDEVHALAIDSANRIYVSGTTFSPDFPVTADAVPKRFAGAPCLVSSPAPFGIPLMPVPCGEAFAARLTASGAIDYATFLSGSAADFAEGIAVTQDGTFWVGGSTHSDDFVTAGGPFSDRRNPGTCSYQASPSAGQSYPCDDGFVASISFGAIPPAPPLRIVNFGSLIEQPITPAAIVTLFGGGIGPATASTLQVGSDGRLTTTLGGTQVLFNGAAAPLIRVDTNQITAIVPNSVAGSAHATITVQRSSAPVVTATVPVNAADPAILTMDPSGGGQAAAINFDGTVNSPATPAQQGSYISLYVIGTGASSDPDGTVAQAARNNNNVSVVIGSPMQTATVLYAGPSPGLISALTQINIKLPAGLTGDRVPVWIISNGLDSQTSMTIAIR